MSHSNSPFKFLDSYEKADVDVFFGREQETQDLYDALSGVKHLLVYGPSGSGKSSLVECGLRNQFSDADWFALTIRKGRNINGSVFQSINEALINKIELDRKTKLPIDPEIGFGEAVEKLFEERYQPVYLLFDQFEELLISGDQQEKVDFFTNLNKLIRNRLPSRVLLIMREEFIGHFSEFEHLCPSIFQHRFRVEKMGRTHVQDVIHAILEAPQYREHFDVENSQELAESILQKLPDKRKEIELSHVQVFLSELWDRAQLKKKENELPVFTKALLRKNDNLESVLESFLIKQIKELENTYGTHIPMELLAVMISERFTKLQLSEAGILAELEQKNVVSKKPVSDLLKELQQRRIVRAIKVGDESQYEISHDTLALVVGQNLTEKIKMREKAMDIYKVYDERQGFFTQDDIDYLRPYEKSLNLPPGLKKRIQDSIVAIEEQRQKEEAQEIADSNKKKKLRILVVTIMVLVALVFASVSLYYETNTLKNKSQSHMLASYAGQQLEQNPNLAIRLAELAWAKWPTSIPALPIQNKVSEAFYQTSLSFEYSLENAYYVSNAQFSPDGKTIVTASDEGTAKIWDAASGNLITNLKGHQDAVYSAVFSPDGKTIVTASGNGTAKIWDAASGILIADLKGHQDAIFSAVFSPDGKTIVTASFDRTAKIWDAASGNLITNLKGHFDRVISALFSPDGKTIVTASFDGTAKIWDAASGIIIADLTGHQGAVYSAVFSPDGKKIASASADNTAKIWNVASGEIIADLIGHQSGVRSAIFSPNGKTIVTASDDGTARLWDAAYGALRADLKGHEGVVNNAEFSPDGKKIVTASDDNIAKIWDATSGNLIANLKGHTGGVNSALFSSDGNKIVTASADKTTKIWDVASRDYSMVHEGAVYSSVFSPDGKTIVTASDNGAAKIWDVSSGILICDLKGHQDAVFSAVFSPDGKTIVTASFDGTAKIWDATSGIIIADLTGHQGAVYSAVFSPDGKKIVSASADNTAKIWNVASGEIIADLIGHQSGVRSAIFLSNGKKILTTSWDSTVKIWDAKSGKLIADLKCDNDKDNCIQSDSDLLTQQLIDLMNNDVDSFYGNHWSELAVNKVPSGESPLVLFEGSRFQGKPCRVDTQFVPMLQKINAYAEKADVFVYVISSFRTTTSLNGRILKPAVRSNHSVGHAFDMNVKYGNNEIANAAMLTKYPNVPDPVKRFLKSVIDDPELRWGGRFRIPDAVHIDDHLNRNRDEWDRIYQRMQQAAQLGQYDLGYIFRAIFSPDGEKIMTISEDNTVKMWDAKSGKLIVELKLHKGAIFSAVFSPDGKKIVTGSADNTAKIWDVESGKLIADLKGHSGGVNSAQFSQDGKKIVTTSSDKTAKMWLTPEGIIEWINDQKNIRKLTKPDLDDLGIDFIKLKD